MQTNETYRRDITTKAPIIDFIFKKRTEYSCICRINTANTWRNVYGKPTQTSTANPSLGHSFSN